MSPSCSSRVAIVDAVSPDWTTNSTCAGSVEAGRVMAVPMSSSTMSLTNGIESAAGLSLAQPRTALLTSGRRAVSRTSEDDPAEHEGEDEELDEAAQATTATASRHGRCVRHGGPAPSTAG